MQEQIEKGILEPSKPSGEIVDYMWCVSTRNCPRNCCQNEKIGSPLQTEEIKKRKMRCPFPLFGCAFGIFRRGV